MWAPELDVVLLSSRGAQVAGGDIDNPIRDAKFLPDLLLNAEELLVDWCALLVSSIGRHLQLSKLLDPE